MCAHVCVCVFVCVRVLVCVLVCVRVCVSLCVFVCVRVGFVARPKISCMDTLFSTAATTKTKLFANQFFKDQTFLAFIVFHCLRDESICCSLILQFNVQIQSSFGKQEHAERTI